MDQKLKIKKVVITKRSDTFPDVEITLGKRFLWKFWSNCQNYTSSKIRTRQTRVWKDALGWKVSVAEALQLTDIYNKFIDKHLKKVKFIDNRTKQDNP